MRGNVGVKRGGLMLGSLEAECEGEGVNAGES